MATEERHNRAAHAPLRVAVFQGAALDGDVAGNVARVAAWASHASTHGCHLALFPELWLQGYDVAPETWRSGALRCQAARGAVRADETSEALCEVAAAAAKSKIAVCVGFAEVAGADEHADTAREGAGDPSSSSDAAPEMVYYNSCVLFSRSGELLLRYRKTHLFGKQEQSVFSVGGIEQLADPDSSTAVLQPSGIRVGALVCFDIEYPEPARVLALHGARLLLVPTALGDGPVARVVPLCTIPSRACENHMHVMYSNMVPVRAVGAGVGDDYAADQPYIPFCGRSAIVAPDGLALQRAPGRDGGDRDDADGPVKCACGAGGSACDGGGAEGTARPAPPEGLPPETLLVADVVPERYAGHFERNPYFALRRPELYGVIATAKPTGAEAAGAGADA